MTMQYREFHEAGFRIFPLWSFKGDKCDCGNKYCLGAGKHPKFLNFPHTPAWDQEQLETMEEMGDFSSGYGVLGRGLLVIDVDARNGGIASYKKMLKDFPEIIGAGLVVETGSGGGSKHLYFSVPEDMALLSHLPQYKGIDLKSGSGGFVVGPGSRHASGKTYQSADGSPYDIGPAPESLLAALRKPERHRTEYNGSPLDVSHADLADMLQYVKNDDMHYDDWIKIGMAIHQATGGTGYKLWDDWSSTSSKYDDRVMEARWHSFGRCANPVTIGTLIFHAEKGGWSMPVTFTPDIEFSETPETGIHVSGNLPFDIAGCDLTCPPGFVGDLARWIESQSRRPRVTLAVAAALTSLGNVAGLRYIDEKDHVTSNLLVFCVAGSRTGKEANLQSVATIQRTAGLSGSTHGNIKSEQEIVKNLIRHQAAFYAIDEIGIFLQKISNAQKRGGAVYLEGVIGTVMSAFSKADDYLLLGGDLKEEVKKMLSGEMSGLQKKLDENEQTAWHEKRIAQIQEQIRSIDNGLKNPFLSLIGFTTPSTFETLVDFGNATNGFIGRSLLFHERDTAPRSKKDFRKADMPENIAATIRQIATGGQFDIETTGRIESVGPRIEVPTDAKAAAMLDDALDWLEDQAIAHKSKSGLESLWLGAYELVSKVSFILAIPEGLRTAEHVRWAFALVKRDVEEKIRLVQANDTEKDAPVDSMKMRIANFCTQEGGETLGVLRRKMKPRKAEEVDKVVNEMERLGLLKKHEGINKYNKTPFIRYEYAGGLQ